MPDPVFPPAPPDAAAEEAWNRIMAIARDHCLITAAYGGVASLAVPRAQRGAGIREKVLRMAHRSEVADG